MTPDEAQLFLTVASQHNGRRYSALDAKSWADMVPAWVTSDLAVEAVEMIFRQDSLDGTHHLLTPNALTEACRKMKGKYTPPAAETTGTVPKSSQARAAATYTSVVQRVAKTNPDRDMNKRGDYFWILEVARGVLAGECDTRGTQYPDDIR